MLVLAIASDQFRIQPEFVSLALLLVAAGPWSSLRALGWMHMSSMWFWAGLNKALAAAFNPGVSAGVAANLGLGRFGSVFGVAIPAGEMLLGLAAAFPRTRRLAGPGAVVLHVGSVWGVDVGPSIAIFWWGLGLAVAAIVLLTIEDPARLEAGTTRDGWVAVVVAAFFIYPAGVYLGWVNPFLGHQLYTASIPSAAICSPPGEPICDPFAPNVSAAATKAPFSPEPRLFEAWFQKVCEPDWELEVKGLRVRTALRGLPGARTYRVACHRARP